MTGLIKTITIVAAAMTGFAIVPAQADDIIVQGHTNFRDLEYAYSGQDRIETARAMLNAAIPIGTDDTAAIAILRQDGARCGKANAEEQIRCTVNSTEAAEDFLHDVAWTIRLDSHDGRVAHLHIKRESIGA